MQGHLIQTRTDTQYSYHLHWYAEECPGHHFRPPCGHTGCSGLCPVCPWEVTPRRSIHWAEFHSVFKQPFKSLRPAPLSHHIKCTPHNPMSLLLISMAAAFIISLQIWSPDSVIFLLCWSQSSVLYLTRILIYQIQRNNSRMKSTDYLPIHMKYINIISGSWWRTG